MYASSVWKFIQIQLFTFYKPWLYLTLYSYTLSFLCYWKATGMRAVFMMPLFSTDPRKYRRLYLSQTPVQLAPWVKTGLNFSLLLLFLHWLKREQQGICPLSMSAFLFLQREWLFSQLRPFWLRIRSSLGIIYSMSKNMSHCSWMYLLKPCTIKKSTVT